MKFILAFTTLIAFSSAQQWFQPQFNYGQPQFGQMPINYSQMPINYGQPAFRLPYQPYPAFRGEDSDLDTKKGSETPIDISKIAQESNSASTRLGKVAPVLMEIRGLKTEIFGNPIQDMAQFRANPPKLSPQGSDDRSAKILKVLLLEELIANFLSVTPAPTTAKRTTRTKPSSSEQLSSSEVSGTEQTEEIKNPKPASSKYELLFVKEDGSYKINPIFLSKSPAEGQTSEGSLNSKKENSNSPNKDKQGLTGVQMKLIVDALVKIPGVSIVDDKGTEVKPIAELDDDKKKGKSSEQSKQTETQSTPINESAKVEEYKINTSELETLKGHSYYVT